VSAAILLALIAALTYAFRALSRRAPTAEAGSWDCGYAAPTTTMQYTSSSFAQMLVGLFGWALRPKTRAPRLRELFPEPETFHSEVHDVVLDRAVLPATSQIARAFGWFRWVQQGSVHAYLLYVLIAVLFGFFWWR
jgi:hypothetical protein